MAFFFITRTANYYYIEQEKQRNTDFNESTEESKTTEEKEYNEDEYKFCSSDEINEFLAYCKTDEYTKAYNMLSSDTKEKKLYNTEEAFINNFINAFIKTGDKIEMQAVDSFKNLYLIEVYRDRKSVV